MASKGWKDLKESLDTWHKKRIEKVVEQTKKDAEKLKFDIIEALNASDNGKTPNTSALSAKIRMDSAAKTKLLAPKGIKKEVKDPLSALDFYTSSIIIEEKGSGIDTTQTVKIDDAGKKDETTGMSLAKIAKAIEFGTTRSAPRPAWRRSLKKLEATGVYRKKKIT